MGGILKSGGTGAFFLAFWAAIAIRKPSFFSARTLGTAIAEVFLNIIIAIAALAPSILGVLDLGDFHRVPPLTFDFRAPLFELVV